MPPPPIITKFMNPIKNQDKYEESEEESKSESSELFYFNPHDFVVPSDKTGLEACRKCGLLKTPVTVTLTLHSGVGTSTARTAGVFRRNRWGDG